jgi:hypothetical protein
VNCKGCINIGDELLPFFWSAKLSFEELVLFAMLVCEFVLDVANFLFLAMVDGWRFWPGVYRVGTVDWFAGENRRSGADVKWIVVGMR